MTQDQIQLVTYALLLEHIGDCAIMDYAASNPDMVDEVLDFTQTELDATLRSMPPATQEVFYAIII